MNKCHLPIFLTPAQAGTQQELRVLSRWLVNQVSVTEKARSGSQGQARDCVEAASGASVAGILS